MTIIGKSDYNGRKNYLEKKTKHWMADDFPNGSRMGSYLAWK